MKNQISWPGVLHVDVKGNVEHKPLVITFDPVNYKFHPTWPKHLVGFHGDEGFHDISTAVDSFEAAMDLYQSRLSIENGERKLLLVFDLSRGESGSFLSVAFHHVAVLGDMAYKLRPDGSFTNVKFLLDQDNEDKKNLLFAVRDTEANRAKMENIIASLHTAGEMLKSVAAAPKEERDALFEAMQITNADKPPVQAEPVQPVQQTLPLADEEEL